MSLFRITTAEGLAWARTAAPDLPMEEHVARERAAMRLRQSPVRPFGATEMPRSGPAIRSAHAAHAHTHAHAVVHPAQATPGGPWPSWEETVLDAERAASRRRAEPEAAPAGVTPVRGATGHRTAPADLPPASGDGPARPSARSSAADASPARAARHAPDGPGRRAGRDGAEAPSGRRGGGGRSRRPVRRAEDEGRRGQRRLLQVAVLVVGLVGVWQLGAHWMTRPEATTTSAADAHRSAFVPDGATAGATGAVGATGTVPPAVADTAAADGLRPAVDAAALGLPLPPAAVVLPDTAQRVERPGLGHWLALTAHSTVPWAQLVEFYRGQAAQEQAARAGLPALEASGGVGLRPVAGAATPAAATPTAAVLEASPGAGQWQLTFQDGADGARRAVLLLQDGDAVRVSLSRWVPAAAGTTVGRGTPSPAAPVPVTAVASPQGMPGVR
ncbi:MAG: hypothetical protein RL223_3246 [Pseudomonadota bacterium]